jgi:hypothetical protein
MPYSPQSYQPLKTAKEVASDFGYTLDYVSRLARLGSIAGEKREGVWWVDPASLEAFLLDVHSKREQRRRELSKTRHKEYRMFQRAQRYVRNRSSSIGRFAGVFSHTIVASAGIFVFLFSFIFGYTFSSIAPKNPADWRMAPGAFIYTLSYDLFSGYLSLVTSHTYLTATIVHTPSYDDFTAHLATLWIDRSLIAKELYFKRNLVQARLAGAYERVGSLLHKNISSGLSWYYHAGIKNSAAGLTGGAEWFRTSVTTGVVSTHDAVAVSSAQTASILFSESKEVMGVYIDFLKNKLKEYIPEF